MVKIAIIGAGLSGLSAAHLLKHYAEITIFEKSRGIGGRISTRRADSTYTFDHGAQYFTARTKPFQSFIQPLVKQNIIKCWNARYVKFYNGKIIECNDWTYNEPHYVGVPNMNVIAKYLAKSLNIYINAKIISLDYNSTWDLKDESGQTYKNFDWVISTLPSPQAHEILPAVFKHFFNIKKIRMRACFSLMLGFLKNLSLDFDAAHIIDTNLKWIAVNSHRQNRKDQYTLVVQSCENYADMHINDNYEDVMKNLISETSDLIGRNVNLANHKSIHAWRYAIKDYNTNQEIPVLLDKDLNLALCGDWSLNARGRIENAFTSAYNLSNIIKSFI